IYCFCIAACRYRSNVFTMPLELLTRNQRTMIVITGFGPYGRTAVNPSWLAAQAVAGAGPVAGMPVQAVELPVEYARLEGEIQALLTRHKPRAVVSLGLWPGEACVRLEKTAANLLDFEIPDNAGALEQNRAVAAGDVGRF